MTQWSIYTVSLVTMEADPGDEGDSAVTRLRRVIMPPTPLCSARVLMILASFITRAPLLATTSQQLSRKMVAIQRSEKMLNKIQAGT